jgi:hypothetical protein
MSRYNSNNGSSNGNSSSDDSNYDDQTTLKLQDYAAVRLTPTNANASSHDQYGTSFIVNYEGAEILDGIVFQREDKPGTWKVFSAGKFFHLNPADGLVYENHDDSGYTGEMSADDILGHPRVAGFSENFGGTDYFYQPVGVVIEEASDISVNSDLDVDTTDEPAIEVGDASMLEGNKPWVRTYAKKLTETGDSIINDDGTFGDDSDNPKYDAHQWLDAESPELRDDVEGRTIELWVTEETTEWDDGTTTTYTTPNVMDVKTGNFVEIDNGVDEGASANTESSDDEAAATDGGTTADTTSDTTDTASPETTDEPSTPSDDDAVGNGMPADVPEKLNDLIDYMARNGETTADEMRAFAEDEVENPDEIDWEAAANEANQRAE